ncbi:unnamed protein product, partial [Symbiodinium sp. KB8]
EKGPDLGLSGFEEAKVARAAQTLENRQRQKPKANQEVFDLWSTPTKAERWKAERADEEEHVAFPKGPSSPKLWYLVPIKAPKS